MIGRDPSILSTHSHPRTFKALSILEKWAFLLANSLVLETTLFTYVFTFISKVPEVQNHHKLHQAPWCPAPSPSQPTLHQSCSLHFSFPFVLLGFRPDTSPTLGLQTNRDFPWVEGRERHLWPQDWGVFVNCINQWREEQANLHQVFYHSDHIPTGEGKVCEDPQPK